MNNKFLEKIASWKDHPVRAAKSVAKAWRETPGASKVSISLGSGSLGVGVLNYESSQRRARNQERSKELEGKSLNVLQGIHKTLVQNSQEKTAEAKKPAWVDEQPELAESARNLAVIGSGGSVIAGSGLAHHAYSRGDLTGRETLYHGSSAENIAKIRQEGLHSGKGGGVSGLPGIQLDEKNKGLVFTSKHKWDAKTYAYQQDAIHKGHITNIQTLEEHRRKGMMGIPIKYGTNKYIAKVNLPTWQKEHKSGMNPEVRHMFRSMKKNPFAALARPLGVSEKDYKKQLVHQLQSTVHTHRGNIDAKYIKGSPHYQGNSMKEIGEYIGHNKERFAKGVGKAVGGAGLVVGGLGAGYEALKKLTPTDD